MVPLMPEHRLLTAESAADCLGVSRATLYAYVSRGFIHAHPAPDDPRRRLYSARDVERLAGNKTRGRKAADIAAATLDFGLPALASGITLIEATSCFFAAATRRGSPRTPAWKRRRGCCGIAARTRSAPPRRWRHRRRR